MFADALALGAYGLAGTRVRAVAEAELVHLGHHGLDALLGLGTSLREQGELADLGADEEHGGAVLARSHAGAAADAAGAVHGLVGVLLRDEDGVGVLRSTRAHGGIAAGLDDLVEGAAVDHAVLDDGETAERQGSMVMTSPSLKRRM
jgi:hypothetical protein